LYKEIDDCNFKFIDSSNLKRFLVKCGLLPTDSILVAIIRRLDLDADARLNQKEFFDGVQPLENYTKGSLTHLKETQACVTMPKKRKAGKYGPFKPTTICRPMTAKPLHSKTTLAHSLHGTTSMYSRDFAVE
jgi:hypothetical protein